MATVKTPVFLDYQSTTPVDPRVMMAMAPFWEKHFGNPHSTAHAHGWVAAEAVTRARAQVADMIHAAAPDEIVFTSGATEANNLALLGLEDFLRSSGKNHVVISAIEHACVRACAGELARRGIEVTVVPVTRDGLVEMEALEKALTPHTGLISIMAVNNEIGTVQPVTAIGAMARARGILFHTDAAQAAGKIPLDVVTQNIDLMSLSAHKMYGPKGIGALYVRQGIRHLLRPILWGGGQEKGLRSGTLPAPLCVGFGAAAALAVPQEESPRLVVLRDHLLQGLRAAIPDLVVNGSLTHRLAGNLNVQLPDITSDLFVAALPAVSLSTGAACSTESRQPSYVLQAMGLSPAQIRSSLRLGLGRFTTRDEINVAVENIVKAYKKARASAA